MLNRQDNYSHHALLLILLGLAGLASGKPPLADERSEQVLAKYFSAIGGRDIWANGHGEYVLAKIQDPRFELPGTFEICFSWDGPLTADRFRVQDSTQYRVFNGSSGWTFTRASGPSDGKVATWDENRKKRGYSEWSENFEVLTHRIARRDADVSTRMGIGPWLGWLEISVKDRIAAYLLVDADGAPRKFFRVFDEIAVVFGPLVQRGELRFPAWGSFEGGEPFDLIAFEILDTVPTQAFQEPSADSRGYMQCH